MVDIVDIVTELRCVAAQLTHAGAFNAIEVAVHRVAQLFERQYLVIKDQFFHCGEAVAHHGRADVGRADKVIFRAAVFQGFTALQRAVNGRRGKGIGIVIFQCAIAYQIAVHRQIGVELQQLVPCGPDFVIRLIIDLAPLFAVYFDQLDAGRRIAAVVHDQLKDFAEVHIGHAGGAMPPAARNCGFHTAH